MKPPGRAAFAAASLVLFTPSLFANEDAKPQGEPQEATSPVQADKDVQILAMSTDKAKKLLPSIDGFLRSYYDSSSDSDPNTGGWRFEQLRVNANGTIDDLKWRVSWELNAGTAKLKDAWLKWKLSEGVGAMWGQFKRPVLHSFKLKGGHRLMILPTLNAANQKREQGAMLNAKFANNKLHGTLALLNGEDKQSEKLNIVARLSYDVLGKGAYGKFEGAVKAPKEWVGGIAVAFADDQDDADGGSYAAVDSVWTGNRAYFHAEFVDYDSEYMGVDKLTGAALADTSTMAFTASHMLGEDKEFAVRFEEWDDLNDTNRLTAGFNYYYKLPHKIKWSLNFTDMSSDDADYDSSTISAGVTINF